MNQYVITEVIIFSIAIILLLASITHYFIDKPIEPMQWDTSDKDTLTEPLRASQDK